MTTLERASQAMIELTTLTGRLKELHVSPLDIAVLQSRLVALYWECGKELNQKFSAKEQALIARKVALAKNTLSIRKDRSSMKQAELEAVDATAQQWDSEAETMVEWDLYQTLLRSIDRAINHSSQMVSIMKTSDTRS